MLPSTKKMVCSICGKNFHSPYHQTRYCSPECKKQGYRIYSRIRKAKNREDQSFTPLFTQRTEWAPQIALTREQEEQALQIAQYCTKSALRYCKLLLIKL